jgi:protein-L-isoaspartate(D-aspartate) O-methyltransferase
MMAALLIVFEFTGNLPFLQPISMFPDTYKHRGLRNKLVRIIRGKGITDPAVLDAVARVPRHVFFDEALLDHAYQDKAFPIGEGQTISQPYTVAFQTQLLKVRPGDKVLEVGTGSGYQACILLELGARLYTIEYNRKLSELAKKMLDGMGYHPHFIVGDGSKGYPAKAPFDRILVTAGAPSVPDTLTDQLAEGGILVIPVGDRDRQKMIRITRQSGKLHKEEFDYFAFVPLLGEKGWKK